jgi:hypothetical protein
MAADTDTTQRIAQLTPLEAVLARIDALVAPVAAREVALASAIGRFVASDLIVAARPRMAVALRDGWAVNSGLAQDAGPYAPAPLPGATRIDVGEPMPAGADAVAAIDAVVVRDGGAHAIAPITSGEGVLPAGADADGRTALLREGQRLHARAAAALAGADVSHIRIRDPRLRVVRSRRDPIVDAATTLAAHAIEAEGGIALLDPDEGLDDALRCDDADAFVATPAFPSSRGWAGWRRTASRYRPARPQPSAWSERGRFCCCRDASMPRSRSGCSSASACWRASPPAARNPAASPPPSAARSPRIWGLPS